MEGDKIFIAVKKICPSPCRQTNQGGGMSAPRTVLVFFCLFNFSAQGTIKF
jgi:hypothetical protein